MELINGSVLDTYLAYGYYRWQKSIFTDNVFYDSINGTIDDVFWLRTNLKKLPNLKELSIYKKNKRFTVTILDFFIDNEIEELYQLYKNNIKFIPQQTVTESLFGDSETESLAIFETKIVQIRDGNKLIASSYFDIGKNSMMDIINFYKTASKSIGRPVLNFSK